MKKQKLGNLEVSAVGLGCMGMSHAYGAVADKKEMTELLAQSVDMGYILFDTAEVYGVPKDPHHNERLLGMALKPYRNKIVLATKFGLSFDMKKSAPYPLIPDSRPETIRKSVENSLKRLQTDHIDLYFQHRNDPKIPIEDVAGIMNNLMEEGKILHWGLSEANEENIRRAHPICSLSAVQNRYSMMARWHEALFPVLEELSIGFVAFSPLANGLLTSAFNRDSHFEPGTDYRSAMPQFRAESYEKNRQLLEFITNLAENYHATPAQISLAWMICKKPWIVPIPGSRNIGRVLENCNAAAINLTAEEVNQIDDILSMMPMSEVFGGTTKTS